MVILQKWALVLEHILYIKHPKNKALLIAFMDKNKNVSNKRKVKRLKPNETKELIVWK